MAYIARVYIVMAFILMGFMVMAYVVMSYIVMAPFLENSKGNTGTTLLEYLSM